MKKRRGLMLWIHRPDGTVQFVPIASREEGEQVIKIAELTGMRDVNGVPVTMEIVEYEDTPL